MFHLALKFRNLSTDKTEVNVLQATSPSTACFQQTSSVSFPPVGSIRLAAVVSQLSRALDLSTGQPLGHSIRACILGMRIGEEIGLSLQSRNDLFYALLLKDCGCSGNASAMFHAFAADELKAKRDVKTVDWTKTGWETLQYALSHVATGKPFLEKSRALFQLIKNQKSHGKQVIKIRCERGAKLAESMGLSQATATGILNLDEHWNGHGQPDGFRKSHIPVISRILLLAQTLEAFVQTRGPQAAINAINQRNGRWFDPDLVKAANSLNKRNALFTDIFSNRAQALCQELEPDQKSMKMGDAGLDKIATSFADIVDAKSPYTYNHSLGVANAAVSIARILGLSRDRVLFLRNAALLHDLGKLGVSNAILEKPAELDAAEWQVMKTHPFYTWDILRGIPGLAEMSEVAGSHHEKLDGSGYFRGLKAYQLSIESRILAVADIFDALSAKRPYRDCLPLERVFSIMRQSVPHALDADCVAALQESGAEPNQTFVNLQNLNDQLLAANRCS